jgi:predicted RNA-binding Zn-ribbon protein involved in translation (DUF1610 family)
MAGEKRNWQALYEEAEVAVKSWRKSHPKATFTEIENKVDEEMARVRAGMIQDMALESANADFRKKESAERPKCPECGAAVQANGEQSRHLVTDHEQRVELQRSQARCPECGATYFPPG